MDKFTAIRLDAKHLDIYYIRMSIFQAIQTHLSKFTGRMLDVGCGQMPYKKYIMENSSVSEYVGIDIDTHLNYSGIQPDIIWSGRDGMPIKTESFSCAMATEVLEHVMEPEPLLSEIYRILRPDGIFFFTVPFLWTLHEVPHDEYRYTPFSLERMLKKQGFQNPVIQPLGGWDASLAQMLGLWVRRNPYLKWKRKLYSVLLKPVIKRLIQNDIKPSEYREGTMINGLFGVIRKSRV
ncbi:MAG: class I SAM-dependent methyltransferase [Desulfobacteraceae bacterium]|nr:MAG: class I SAM-dependent methyltransferase [Desulfobacteraceae bacterium]